MKNYIKCLTLAKCVLATFALQAESFEAENEFHGASRIVEDGENGHDGHYGRNGKSGGHGGNGGSSLCGNGGHGGHGGSAD